MAKSRTSKNSNNKSKFNPWYMVAIVLVVVIAGYAIVRFSQAAPFSYKKVDLGTIENCGPNVIEKTSAGKFCSVKDGQSVYAIWRSDQVVSGTNKICALVYLRPGAIVMLRATSNLPFSQNLDTGWSSYKNASTGDMNYTICRNISDNFYSAYKAAVLAYANTTIKGEVKEGYKGVLINSMWLETN